MKGRLSPADREALYQMREQIPAGYKATIDQMHAAAKEDFTFYVSYARELVEVLGPNLATVLLIIAITRASSMDRTAMSGMLAVALVELVECQGVTP